MTKIRALAATLALACAPQPPPPRVAPAPTVTPATAAPEPPPPLLSDEVTVLGRGCLRGRLPRGTLRPPEDRAVDPGVLAPSEHVIERPQGPLRIAVLDDGSRAGDDFAARAIEAERGTECVGDGEELAADPPFETPPDFQAVAFTPGNACSTDSLPAVRIWIRSPDGTVSSIAAYCDGDPCLPDRRELLQAFVLSLAPGEPTPAPAGPRVVHLTPYLDFALTVPEGFLLQQHDGEDYTTYELFRRVTMGGRYEGIGLGAFFVSSDNTLQQDYLRTGERSRSTTGRVAGRRARMLEVEREGSTRVFARVMLDELQLDVDFTAASPSALAELRALVADAQLHNLEEDEPEEDE